MIFCGALLLAVALSTEAQTARKKTKKTSQSATAGSDHTAKSSATVLNSTAAYPAKSSIRLAPDSTASTRFLIADPVISQLNAKARGETDRSSLEIVGLSRHAFGFANGKIRLTPAGSTSSGGVNGLGGVATGNGMGAIGAAPAMPGVNGKSPDAGSGMWGNARNLQVKENP